MEKTLKELADIAGGDLEGDGSVLIRGVAGLKEAKEGDITFLANPKYAKDLKNTKASAVIAGAGVTVEGRGVIRAKNPYLAFAKVVTAFAPPNKPPLGVMAGSSVSPYARVGDGVTIHANVHVESGAHIGDGVTLLPGVYVGEGSSIGDGSLLYPNVVVREGVKIGRRVIIHAGSVIGADGFGYATDQGRHYKIPQIGGVVIEDDVEIGANATVDRGALGNTVIKRGTKIDNLVMIAHNVVVGEDSIIVAQAGISGSTELGSHVVLAGQVGLVGHIKVGDNVMVGAKSGVSNDLGANQVYSGIPAMPHREWLKVQAVLGKLPEMRKLLNGLDKRLKMLEGEKGETGGE